MGEALKNQVINTIKYTYTKELKNKYTVFLGITRRDLIKHLIYRYGKMKTVDLDMKNLQMN